MATCLSRASSSWSMVSRSERSIERRRIPSSGTAMARRRPTSTRSARKPKTHAGESACRRPSTRTSKRPKRPRPSRSCPRLYSHDESAVTLPVLHLDGAPYDQGLQHGRALRNLIEENLQVYFDRFEREGKLPAAEARERAARYL